MFKELKRIKRLECVQEGGFQHFVAHLIGTQSPSRCYLLANCRWGRFAAEGLRAGIEKVQIGLDESVRKIETIAVEVCYKDELKKLQARIGDEGGLVSDLKDRESRLFIKELRALNELSDTELKEYLKLHKEKKKLELETLKRYGFTQKPLEEKS